MTRPVSPADVLVLIPGTSITDLTPFITTANLLTNRLAASPCGSGLTEPELEQIEKYLAAHFASIADPSLNVTSQTVGKSSVTISKGNVASMDGLLATQYGQTANALSGGCLYEITKPKPSVAFF